MKNHETNNKRSEELGCLLTLCIIGVFSALAFISVIFGGVQSKELEPGVNTVIIGLSAITAGFIFIAAHYYPHKAALLRIIQVFSNNFVYPKSDDNTLLGATVLFITGVVFILFGVGIF